MRDHYQILEIDRRACPEVVTAAAGALEAKFKGTREIHNIIQAKAELIDPLKRKNYDRGLTDAKGKVVGNYRILNRIAEGGFGVTYKGEHILTKGAVCLKHCSNISPEDDEILLNEADVMWDLRHFAIPAVRDVIRMDDGSLILVTSFIEGPTLEQAVDKVGPIEAEHVAWITERIINALWYMHERGVVHGDLKPQNTILQHKNHMACLVDFGLSMIKPSSSDSAKGYTEYFAPPEQIAGKPLLPESDFYSLGITMIYALSGGDLDRVAAKQIPASVPDPMTEFIKRLIVRDVLKRPSWENENLFETWQRVRVESFGVGHTNMKPIKGL